MEVREALSQISEIRQQMWQMGISFGGGQLLAAAILYWTLERTNGTQGEG